jgi:hypothetical protein
MRGTDCEREESSRELRNVYRSNLASGVIEELGVIEEFEVTRDNEHFLTKNAPHYCSITNSLLRRVIGSNRKNGSNGSNIK